LHCGLQCLNISVFVFSRCWRLNRKYLPCRFSEFLDVHCILLMPFDQMRGATIGGDSVSATLLILCHSPPPPPGGNFEFLPNFEIPTLPTHNYSTFLHLNLNPFVFHKASIIRPLHPNHCLLSYLSPIQHEAQCLTSHLLLYCRTQGLSLKGSRPTTLGPDHCLSFPSDSNPAPFPDPKVPMPNTCYPSPSLLLPG